MSGKWYVRRGRSSLRWYASPNRAWWGGRTFRTHAEALAYAIAQAEAGR